ncbi:MAG: Ap4A phosphorylase II [Candidatus Thiodiazotropha sp.]
MAAAFTPGRLWQMLTERTRQAKASGHLHSIETNACPVSENGIEFVVRVAANLKRKAEDKKKRAADFNPFLPPEPELTVCELSDTHRAVLNKFNVVDHHLLIVTRAFEDQERLLTQADFEALWQCLGEYPSLGFYNGGAAAGASQKHKHLQLVPLPLYPNSAGNAAPYPFASLLEIDAPPLQMMTLMQWPFLHRWCGIPADWSDAAPATAARNSLRIYLEMLADCGIESVFREGGTWQSAPYNLLMTRHWMLLVPRSREFSQGISVNALGYLGSLFVTDPEALQRLSDIGPLRLLDEVSQPKRV